MRILVTQFNHPLIYILLGSDGCLATGEDAAEKSSEFRVGIEPMTSIDDAIDDAGWMIYLLITQELLASQYDFHSTNIL